ncbi:Flavorubredoxin [Desulfotomaculum arcticum]|uniref:Flavorubredoxin n=1 Tax=Desulfotruncus arcticus DSM 17038 TaxID=1121424 RepID=A0A1I2UC25_9FIRM|nr:FprA family A-type flavoprotein [Desulfotruncus arcticus]SFG72396.1 Flavorubredoxin [Desulfotomaculum arcticum] [Desulfotruncus arcticus DSM 17038]
MKPVELKPGIYWVGGIDWNLRYFHGYVTPRGTTYNAYLIVDEKITLVDTVKHYLCDEMLDRIKQIIDPSKIDYMVSNHVEMDHSGSLPKIMELAPNAQLVTSPQGQKGLKRYYKKDNWNFKVVNSGEELSIGSRTLKFVHVPMVHWPDSMVTYIPEEKLLLPNDAFGQHIASAERFDDQLGWEIVHEEAATYYANIVLPYGDNVNKALDVVTRLDIDMVAPSHGVIWRSLIPKIVPVYRKWAGNETDPKALIVYDTMWDSTRRVALALQDGLEDAGVPVTMRFLQTNHISEIMTDLLTARAILIGTPTLNNGMLPTVSAFLTYIRGLRPKKRIGLAFGSYGWGGQGAKEVAGVIKDMGWETPLDFINIQYRPDGQELQGVRETGKKLGEMITN